MTGTGAVRTADDGTERRMAIILLAMVTAGALAQRVFLLVATDFPINDGGLFYAFVKAVAGTFPGLPDYVRFNGIAIPFAYPPLSFWLAALLTRLGVDALAIVHVLPILMNMAYVLLFALVLRRSGRPLLFVAIALFFLCTTPRTFEWLVMGGGLSRGLGSLFLMATLLAVGIPDRGRETLPARRLALAGAAVAGAILSHLEWGLDAASCVLLSRALGSPSLKDFVRSNLIAGGAALLLIMPWLLWIYSVHGLTPLFAAGGSSAWGISYTLAHLYAIQSDWVANPLIPIGLVVLCFRKQCFWPLFVLICIVVTPRHGATPLTLAFAVFAAQAVTAIYAGSSALLRNRPLAAVCVAAIALLLAGRGLDANFLARGTRLRVMAPETREAMAWVAAHHRGDRFIVLTPFRWYYDSSAEWFPVLAAARSLNTLQGREWIPGAYRSFYDRDSALKRAKTCPEIFERLHAYERPRFLWAEWRRDCFAAAGYRPVYRNPRVTIFAVPQPDRAASPRPEAGEDGADRSRDDQHVHPE